MKNIAYLFLFLLASCAATKGPQPDTVKTSSSVSTTEKTDSLLTAIERYPCFGACPEYKLTIYKSGYTTYEGRRNVEKLGGYSSQLSAAQLNDVYSKIRAYNLENRDSSYVNIYLADYPGWKLWVADKNPRKEIMIMHEAPPEELTKYGEFLDGIPAQLNWTKISSANRD